jgi:hypothetical protein
LNEVNDTNELIHKLHSMFPKLMEAKIYSSGMKRDSGKYRSGGNAEVRFVAAISAGNIQEIGYE